MNYLDTTIQNYLAGIRTPVFTQYMYIVSRFFDFTFYFLLLLFCVTVLVYLFRGKKLSFLFVGSILFTGIFVSILKLFFDTKRPVDAVMQVFGPSFPSYHATVVVVFFFMLMHIFDGYFKFFGKIFFNTFFVLMIIFVSFSRLYLGVHWFSDVLAGLFLGAIISYLSVVIQNKLK